MAISNSVGLDLDSSNSCRETPRSGRRRALRLEKPRHLDDRPLKTPSTLLEVK